MKKKPSVNLAKILKQQFQRLSREESTITLETDSGKIVPAKVPFDWLAPNPEIQQFSDLEIYGDHFIRLCEFFIGENPGIDDRFIEAAQQTRKFAEYLNFIVRDEELKQLPDSAVKKILEAIHCFSYCSRMTLLQSLIPVLNTEQQNQIIEKLDTLQDTIEDRNRHRGERWATVPDCIKAVKDMVEIERKDGKKIALPGKDGKGSFETLRINVSAHLKKARKRRRGSDAKPYYQTADIAEAIAFYYKAFTATQYLREFEHIEMPGADILDGEPKREEQAKKIRGISED